MAVSQDLHKKTVQESLCSETATGWTSTKEQVCTGGTDGEVSKALGNATQVHLHGTADVQIKFDATASADQIAAADLLLKKDIVHTFLIPNGATHLHVKGAVGSGNEFCYVVIR
jgi:hypothetical protein